MKIRVLARDTALSSTLELKQNQWRIQGRTSGDPPLHFLTELRPETERLPPPPSPLSEGLKDLFKSLKLRIRALLITHLIINLDKHLSLYTSLLTWLSAILVETSWYLR